jgi:hypothetical protein
VTANGEVQRRFVDDIEHDKVFLGVTVSLGTRGRERLGEGSSMRPQSRNDDRNNIKFGEDSCRLGQGIRHEDVM